MLLRQLSYTPDMGGISCLSLVLYGIRASIITTNLMVCPLWHSEVPLIRVIHSVLQSRSGSPDLPYIGVRRFLISRVATLHCQWFQSTQDDEISLSIITTSPVFSLHQTSSSWTWLSSIILMSTEHSSLPVLTSYKVEGRSLMRKYKIFPSF